MNDNDSILPQHLRHPIMRKKTTINTRTVVVKEGYESKHFPPKKTSESCYFYYNDETAELINNKFARDRYLCL